MSIDDRQMKPGEPIKCFGCYRVLAIRYRTAIRPLTHCRVRLQPLALVIKCPICRHKQAISLDNKNEAQ